VLSDYQLVLHKFPKSFTSINIYPLSDIHIEASESDRALFIKLLEHILEDPTGYLVLVGDIFNNALKTSKSNVYKDIMSPSEAKDYLTKALRPLAKAGRILGGTAGNHEYRSVREVDLDPLYDVFARLGIEDVYRQNLCMMKISLGSRAKNRQISYAGVLTHGTSTNKQKKFITNIDNADFFIFGHTHDLTFQPYMKLKIDLYNNTVIKQPYYYIVCNSFLKYADYAIRGMYTPKEAQGFQYITLSGTKKHISYHYKEWD
jgi:UDP-2,3-diacylglucosamine pyrophosphatase LpxH